MFAAGFDRPPRPCTYCNRCLGEVLRNPLGCYEQSRFDSYDEMMKEIMSVYEPAPYVDVEAGAAGEEPGAELVQLRKRSGEAR